MTGTVGTSSGNKEITGIYVGTQQGRKEVLRAFVGTASGNKVWYEKPGLTMVDLTATALNFYQIRLDWTVVGPVDRYRIYRNSVLIYDQPASAGMTLTNTNLEPSREYTYRIDAILGGAAISSDTASAATTAAPAITATASNAKWDRIDIAWSNIGAEGYEVYRRAYPSENYSLVYQGGWRTSFTDVGLNPGTWYIYAVYGLWGGQYYSGIHTNNGNWTQTPARSGMGFYASGQQGQIYFAWNDQNGGGVDSYQVWLYNPSTYIIGSYPGPGAGEGYHTGLPNGWTGYYELTAFRGGQVIAKEQAGANTWVLRTGSVAGHGAASSGVGYTGATQQTLTGRAFTYPVSGTMTNVNAVIYAYAPQSSQARVAPVIGGVERQHSIVGTTRQANNLGVSVGYAAGTHQTNIRCGGSSPPPIGSWAWAAWSAVNGVAWNYNVCVHRMDYEYWSTTRSFEELRQHEWWDRSLEDNERDFHLDTWDDGEGTIIRARITDKDSGETLVDWQREG